MVRARLISTLVAISCAAASAEPAAAMGTRESAVVAQQASPAPTRPPARPAARPTARPPARPTAAPPARPNQRPPAQATARPPARPTPAPPRPTARPPARPTPRPTANPWRPNRPPQHRPPPSGWQRPNWANQPRPPWAHNNGFRPNYVLVNPRFAGRPWGWNNGLQWYARPNYWGGGFWGPFALFTLTVGQALWEQNRFYEPGLGSPGWWLFQNYGLVPARCGPQNLVYIYGPNDSVMCAYPNMYVQAGFYYVDPATLQLFVM
jgi:hypothetical protein